MTPWQQQQAAMLDAESRKYAKVALDAFRALKRKLLEDHAKELKTKRQVLDGLRRKYDALLAVYLRTPCTTYDGWIEHGPKAEWEEVLAATHDEAVWDRLVETYGAREA